MTCDWWTIHRKSYKQEIAAEDRGCAVGAVKVSLAACRKFCMFAARGLREGCRAALAGVGPSDTAAGAKYLNQVPLTSLAQQVACPHAHLEIAEEEKTAHITF